MTPVGHAQPPRGSLETLLPSEAQVSHRVLRGCREEGRQGAPNRVCAVEWCRGSTVPCLCPLSVLEGGTPCTGHQPLTQGDQDWPGPGLCEGGCDLSPRPSPNEKTNGIQSPKVLASPGFWPRAERAFSQLNVAFWALGEPHRSRLLT